MGERHGARAFGTGTTTTKPAMRKLTEVYVPAPNVDRIAKPALRPVFDAFQARASPLVTAVDCKQLIADCSNSSVVTSLSGEWFDDPARNEVLERISLRAEKWLTGKYDAYPGHCTAIFGVPGVGKTELLRHAAAVIALKKEKVITAYFSMDQLSQMSDGWTPQEIMYHAAVVRGVTLPEIDPANVKEKRWIDIADAISAAGYRIALFLDEFQSLYLTADDAEHEFRRARWMSLLMSMVNSPGDSHTLFVSGTVALPHLLAGPGLTELYDRYPKLKSVPNLNWTKFLSYPHSPLSRDLELIRVRWFAATGESPGNSEAFARCLFASANVTPRTIINYTQLSRNSEPSPLHTESDLSPKLSSTAVAALHQLVRLAAMRNQIAFKTFAALKPTDPQFWDKLATWTCSIVPVTGPHVASHLQSAINSTSSPLHVVYELIDSGAVSAGRHSSDVNAMELYVSPLSMVTALTEDTTADWVKFLEDPKQFVPVPECMIAAAKVVFGFVRP